MQTEPLTVNTKLTDFFLLPRQILTAGLPGASVILYALILDRADLSRKSGWTDEHGRIYVLYKMKALSLKAGLCEASIRRYLKKLIEADLIECVYSNGNKPNKYFIKIPCGTISKGEGVQNDRVTLPKQTGLPFLNRHPNHNNINHNNLVKYTYSHGEDESL